MASSKLPLFGRCNFVPSPLNSLARRSLTLAASLMLALPGCLDVPNKSNLGAKPLVMPTYSIPCAAPI